MDRRQQDTRLASLVANINWPQRTVKAMSTQPQRTCPSCGNEFSGAMEFCPVCMLRKGLAGGVVSAESYLEEAVRPTPEQATQRFEHYELVTGEDGKPVELGRGAMGVTYKAFDIDLHCPVTLKVISARYISDESVRVRFLREARAAASVRHQNVASALHLGRTGSSYFYAMEFVEGETLESLIKRSGRLEVRLALEIATQVAAGLAAVHKQKLVHRDIKPSNIMVNIEEGSAVTAKIIDLGLAKAVNEPGSQTSISMPGGFAGTPEFASPEQFAGVSVDIRSDLYALGVTLWQTVTGHSVFRGSPAEVMYQHQHAPLPLKELEHVSQPVVALLEVLLEKNPGQRFQTPAELLKTMPTITGAIDARRRITRQSLNRTPSADLRVGTRKTRARLGPKKISVARLPVTGSDVFGREEDIAFLDHAWTRRHVNVVTIVAWAGVGKSTLVNHWLRRMAAEQYRSAELVFGWSFYRHRRLRFHWFGRGAPPAAPDRPCRGQRRQAHLRSVRGRPGGRKTPTPPRAGPRGHRGRRGNAPGVRDPRTRRGDAPGRRDPCRSLDRRAGGVRPDQRRRDLHPAGGRAPVLAYTAPARGATFRFDHVSTDEVFGALEPDDGRSTRPRRTTRAVPMRPARPPPITWCAPGITPTGCRQSSAIPRTTTVPGSSPRKLIPVGHA